jgi:hypothetical protein
MIIHSRLSQQLEAVLSSTLFDKPLLLSLWHLVLPLLSLGFFDSLLPFLTISDCAEWCALTHLLGVFVLVAESSWFACVIFILIFLMLVLIVLMLVCTGLRVELVSRLSVVVPCCRC